MMTLCKARWWMVVSAETLKHTHTHTPKNNHNTIKTHRDLARHQTLRGTATTIVHFAFPNPHVLHPGPGEARPDIGSHRAWDPYPPNPGRPTRHRLPSLCSPPHTRSPIYRRPSAVVLPWNPARAGPGAVSSSRWTWEPDLMIVAAMPLVDACHIDSHVAARSRSEWLTCGFCFRWA